MRVSNVAIYAVRYVYTDNEPLRREVLPAHVDYLDGIVAAGALLLAGRFADEGTGDALLIFRAEQKDFVKEFVESDPFVVRGVVHQWDLSEWRPSMGLLAENLTELPQRPEPLGRPRGAPWRRPEPQGEPPR